MVKYINKAIDLKYAKKLRALRLKKDIKQIEAAQLLGIKNQQYYSKLENGQMTFTKEIIAKICKIFELSNEDFTSSEEKHETADNNGQLQGTTDKLSMESFVIRELINSKNELINHLKKEIGNLKKRKR